MLYQTLVRHFNRAVIYINYKTNEILRYNQVLVIRPLNNKTGLLLRYNKTGLLLRYNKTGLLLRYDKTGLLLRPHLFFPK